MVRLAVSLVAVLLLAASCRPRVEPVEVEFRRLSLEEMKHGTIELAISNPNRFEVNVEALRYALLLGTDTVALGSRRMPVHIPGRDSTRAEFPFELRYDFGDLLGRLPQFLSDTVWLRLEGQYRLPGLGAGHRLPFRHARAVPLGDEVRRFTEGIKGFFGGD